MNPDSTLNPDSALNKLLLQPFGVRLAGLDLGSMRSDEIWRLRELLSEYGFLVFPDQAIDDAGFVAFLEQFGELTFTAGETPVDGFANLNVVSNVGRSVPPRSTFHVDTSYVRHPPAYTALRAVTIPHRGGATLFSNQYRAYQTLTDGVRSTLEGRTIRHVVTGVEPGADGERAADHPVLRPHPTSGRIALYLTSPERCAAISGLTEAEAAKMVRWLFDHSTQDNNIYRHAWSPGDIVMWDNACVLHRADHDGVVGDRVMHRGMVAGYHQP